VPDCPTVPMLLWMMSTPFEGILGSEDSGQTNDGPLVWRGQALIRSRVLKGSVTRTIDRQIGTKSVQSTTGVWRAMVRGSRREADSA
jgi:hypothetical protein